MSSYSVRFFCVIKAARAAFTPAMITRRLLCRVCVIVVLCSTVSNVPVATVPVQSSDVFVLAEFYSGKMRVGVGVADAGLMLVLLQRCTAVLALTPPPPPRLSTLYYHGLFFHYDHRVYATNKLFVQVT